MPFSGAQGVRGTAAERVGGSLIRALYPICGIWDIWCIWDIWGVWDIFDLMDIFPHVYNYL